MPRQAAGDQEDGIDADVIALTSIARRQALGGRDDAPQPVFVKRHCRRVLGGPRLDLDEGEDAAAAGDKIHLAARSPGAARKNSPAVQAQPPRGNGLALAPALFGDDPTIQRLSSSARA